MVMNAEGIIEGLKWTIVIFTATITFELLNGNGKPSIYVGDENLRIMNFIFVFDKVNHAKRV